MFESFKPRYDAIIDLNKPITTLFGNMNKNFKNKVKGADKNGVRIIKGNEKEIDYAILKNIFCVRVINLEDLYLKITKEKEKYYIQLFDENVFEEKIKIENINYIDKKDLTIKINKKVKIFN